MSLTIPSRIDPMVLSEISSSGNGNAKHAASAPPKPAAARRTKAHRRVADNAPPPPPPREIFSESYTIREAHAFAYPGNEGVASQIIVELRTPGTYVTEQTSCNIRVTMHGGPDKAPRDFDCYAADLDALVVALQEAIRAARKDGVIEAAGHTGGDD